MEKPDENVAKHAPRLAPFARPKKRLSLIRRVVVDELCRGPEVFSREHGGAPLLALKTLGPIPRLRGMGPKASNPSVQVAVDYSVNLARLSSHPDVFVAVRIEI